MTDQSIIQSWLESCVREINPFEKFPVVVEDAMHTLHIHFEKKIVDRQSRLKGEARRVGTSVDHKIILFREFSGSQHLTRSERFTIAHEIAHVLIDRRFAYIPSTNADFWSIEKLCDSFAGQLLIPKRALSYPKLEGPDSFFSGLSFLSNRCEVSIQAAAYRFVEKYNQLIIFHVQPSINAKGIKVARVAWSAPQINRLGIHQNRHIKKQDLIGSLLLQMMSQPLAGQLSSIKLFQDGELALKISNAGVTAIFFETNSFLSELASYAGDMI